MGLRFYTPEMHKAVFTLPSFAHKVKWWNARLLVWAQFCTLKCGLTIRCKFLLSHISWSFFWKISVMQAAQEPKAKSVLHRYDVIWSCDPLALFGICIWSVARFISPLQWNLNIVLVQQLRGLAQRCHTCLWVVSSRLDSPIELDLKTNFFQWWLYLLSKHPSSFR